MKFSDTLFDTTCLNVTILKVEEGGPYLFIMTVIVITDLMNKVLRFVHQSDILECVSGC